MRLKGTVICRIAIRLQNKYYVAKSQHLDLILHINHSLSSPLDNHSNSNQKQTAIDSLIPAPLPSLRSAPFLTHQPCPTQPQRQQELPHPPHIEDADEDAADTTDREHTTTQIADDEAVPGAVVEGAGGVTAMVRVSRVDMTTYHEASRTIRTRRKTRTRAKAS